MANKVRYPQIPSTVWWGLRGILHKTPNMVVDERLLSVQLGVQATAAKAYLFELRSVGILSEDGKATPLALKWRLDETYKSAVDTLIRDAYPESLIAVAPPGEAERSKVISWFKHEGLGEGTATNKASTYILLSSLVPNEAPRAGSRTQQGDSVSRTRLQNTSEDRRSKTHSSNTGNEQIVRESEINSRRKMVDAFPLNVNVQIHISADAGADQIDSIFQAMRRYLHDAPDS